VTPTHPQNFVTSHVWQDHMGTHTTGFPHPNL
jgi:hypothetical protein